MPRAAVACGFITLALALTSAAAERTGERPASGLDATVQATWARVPLRDWTNRVTLLAGKPVILDRRIDPDRLVTRNARGESLGEVLRGVASEAGAAVEELPGSIRLVPQATAGRATDAAADRDRRLAALPASQRKALTGSAAWNWPAGSRPRELVAGALAEAGLTVEGIDAVPHDHFPAADLPPLPLAERLDLVLAHFDLRILWSADRGRPAGRIVAIDADLAPRPAVRPGAQAEAARSRRPPGPPTGGARLEDEFTLRLEAPLDQALTAIAGRLGLDLDLDADSLAARGIATGEIVRAEVEKASRAGLLDAVLRPVDLEWKIEGRRLRVFAAEPSPSP